MVRRARVQYPGAVYHVMDRGDQRKAIFRDDEDRERFLTTLGESMRAHRLATARLCADEQPLSFHARNPSRFRELENEIIP
jgi:hypothetical protein